MRLETAERAGARKHPRPRAAPGSPLATDITISGRAQPSASLIRGSLPRRAVIGALVALVLATPAAGQPKLLMPGVTYEKQVQFTFHGPSVIHVLTMPRPGGLWALKPVLSNDAILGLERVTSIQQRVSATATVAGVNGDRFVSNGRPSGILMRDGQLQHGPGDSRSSIGIDSGGNLRVERVRLLPTWQGTGQRQNLSAVNNSPSSSGMSLYTPTWGPATPAAPGSLEVVLRPFPATLPNTEVVGPRDRVAQRRRDADPAVTAPCSSPAARRRRTAFATRRRSGRPCACGSCSSPTGPASWTPSAAGRRSCATARRSSTPARRSSPASSRSQSRGRPWASWPTGGSSSSSSTGAAAATRAG